MRSDFSTVSNGKTTTMHMIIDGKDSYTWLDGMETGFMMSLSTTKPANVNAQSQGVDPDKKVDYACQPWIADASLFVVPSDVKFTDYSAMMQGSAGATMNANTNTTMNKCAVCDSLTGDSKTQCKTAMGC